MNNKMVYLLLLVVLSAFMTLSSAFTIHQTKKAWSLPLRMSSYTSDSSDYSSKDSDYENDDDDWDPDAGARRYREKDEFDATELKPLQMSKNAGNRFVAILWDRLVDREGRDPVVLHYDRIKLTEAPVIACRKANLYNETFNAETMVDVVWSRQILSSDVQRVIGQAMCLESSDIKYVKEFMKTEPLMHWFTGGDISNILLYRWRHYREHTLRQDDGRHGTPCMLLSMDHDAEEGTGKIRDDDFIEHVEYLIRSERVICAGSLHLPTGFKDDPSSLPVGDLIMFNAKDRDEAIRFAENEPRAQKGLYKTMQVHFYNNLDVTGKFVCEDDSRDAPCADLREAMGIWGYPIDDNQTPWQNW